MIIESIILGIVQGLTEFLPISSSGHLAILENIFGIEEPVTMATFLHFGTFLATLVFFIKPIGRIFKGIFLGERDSIRYLLYIFVGSIPIVIFALLFKTYIENAFGNTTLIALFLGITGTVVIMTGMVKKFNGSITLVSALIIGLCQMFATFPGISRSGMTISAGLFSRVGPKKAFTFSFLLSLPAVLGANIYEFSRISKFENVPGLITGMVLSFISGFIALIILRRTIRKGFHLFGIYCLIISVLLLLIG
jgi:undecaprenyl-diphosphatase